LNRQESMSNHHKSEPEGQEKTTLTPSPGGKLRRLRQEKDLSIEVVSEATKISLNNIRAIEQEDYEKLPVDTFAKGLITLYGNFLGIDGAQIAAEFLAERDKKNPNSGRLGRAKKTIRSASLRPKKLAEPAHISSATIALMLLAFIVLSFTGFCLYTSWNPFAFISQQTENMPASMLGIFSSTPSAPPSDDETTEPAARYTLSALFLKDSIVTSTIDDQEPTQQTFTKNETGQWVAQDSLKIVFDQADAATLSLNDSALTFPEPQNNQRPTLLVPNDLLDQ